MRITQESDYALRILTALAEHDGVVDANSLSEETSVTLRFTLKILNKRCSAISIHFALYIFQEGFMMFFLGEVLAIQIT